MIEMRSEVPGRVDDRPVVDVAVIIPVANRPDMLSRALESVRAQTVRPREVIVVDDASVDDTPDVAIAHGATLVRLEVNGGPGPARNAGIARATTTWIAFLDSDDQWLPGHLAKLVAAGAGQVLVSAPAVSTHGRVVGNPWRRDVRLTPRRIVVPVELVCTSGTMVRREVCTAVGGFPALRRAEDLDLWLRVLECGPGVALGCPTLLYNQHATQAVSDGAGMRSAFEDVLLAYAERPWFRRRTLDQSLAHVRWDEFRAALREREPRPAAAALAWLLVRPLTWWPLLQLFAARRFSRHPLQCDAGSLPG